MAGTEVDATFYLQVEPERSSWQKGPDGELVVTGAKAVRITQARPARPVAGSVLVKLTVRLPVAAFAPLRPEALVVVPASLIQPTPVAVIATDPAEHLEGQ